MVRLSIACGLRRSELPGLRWRNVDLDGCTLRVEESFVAGRFEDLKTDKSRRIVGLDADTAALLKAQRQRSRAFEPDAMAQSITLQAGIVRLTGLQAATHYSARNLKAGLRAAAG